MTGTTRLPADDRLDPVRHDALTMAGGWGWSVFPCVPGGKVPATGHGFTDATVDPDRIISWFADRPDHNVAVATGAVSGLVVIDVDPGGSSPLRGLIAEHGPLPATAVVHTPRGGWHGFYAHPGGRVRCSAGKIAPNVDIRADGGYVVAPPSIVDGKRYLWREEPWPGPPTLATLPDAWIELLRAPVRDVRPPPRPTPPPALIALSLRHVAWARKIVNDELQTVAGAPDGTRNDTLNRASFRLGQLAAAGVLEADPARNALEISAQACGLPPGEARRTIGSGFASGLNEPAVLPGVSA